MAPIGPATDPTAESRIRAFNTAVPAAMQSKGTRVHVVNMHDALTTAGLADTLHRSAGGYANRREDGHGGPSASEPDRRAGDPISRLFDHTVSAPITPDTQISRAASTKNVGSALVTAPANQRVAHWRRHGAPVSRSVALQEAALSHRPTFPVVIVALSLVTSCKLVAKEFERKSAKMSFEVAESVGERASRAAEVHLSKPRRASRSSAPLVDLGEAAPRWSAASALDADVKTAARNVDEVLATKPADVRLPGERSRVVSSPHAPLAGIDLDDTPAAHAQFRVGAVVRVEMNQSQKKEAKTLVARGDEVLGRGDLARAADRYERAAKLDPGAFTSRDGRARAAITALVRNHGETAAEALNDVLTAYDTLSPGLERGLLHAMEHRASQEVNEYLSRVLNGSASTINGEDWLKVAWYRGRLTTMRDVKAGAPVEPARWRTSVSEYTVYVDDRISVGQEGLLHDLLHDPDAWRRHPDVQIEYLGSIGELSGLLHHKPRGIFAQKVARRPPLAGLVVLVSLRDSPPRPQANPR